MKNQLVLIEWIDSTAQHGWGKYEDADLSCVSVGFLLKKEKDRIVIFRDQSPYQNGAYIAIPTAAIKRIRRLKCS